MDLMLQLLFMLLLQLRHEGCMKKTSTLFNVCLYNLLIVITNVPNVATLKLLDVDVPPYTFKGESARLVCRYDLESDKLYSVLWYKDNEEFYKYVNSDRSQHIYQVEGIRVDHRNSDSQKVILQRVTLDATGVYKCEVSAEAPNFVSVNSDAYMEVIALPTENPTITGEEKIHASGDILTLNCTSGKSYPPATITWFINGLEVKPELETMVRHHDLISTISCLRLEIGPHHLSGGRIDVRCTSVIETSYQATKRLEDLRDTHVFIQGHSSLHHSCFSLVAVVSILHWILILR